MIVQIRKSISIGLIAAFLITSNNSYSYKNNIIKKSKSIKNSVLALPHTQENQIQEEILKHILLELRSLTMADKIKKIKEFKTFFSNISSEVLFSKTGNQLVKELIEIAFNVLHEEKYKQDAPEISNIITSNRTLLQRLSLPQSDLKKRDPEDPIRIIGQPYLPILSKMFTDHFKKPVSIYVVMKNEDTNGLGNFNIIQQEDQVVVYISKTTELFLTGMYWQLEKENPGKANCVISKIFEFALKGLERELHQSDIDTFFEENKFLSEEFRSWIDPESKYNSNSSQTLLHTILDLGMQMMDMIYVAKRQANNNLTQEAKMRLEKLSDQNKNELKKWEKDIKAKIDIMKKEFFKTFGYEILEFHKEWSYKELERLKKTFEEIPGAKNSKYIRSISRWKDSRFSEGGFYSLIFRQIGFSSKVLNTQIIIHEFAHSLQSGAIPNLGLEWKLRMLNDPWFISAYALTSWQEDFSESMAVYMTDPDKLELACPYRYEYLKEKVFKGKEFRDYVIEQYKYKSIETVVTEQNITLMNYFLEIGKISRQELKTKYGYLWENYLGENFNRIEFENKYLARCIMNNTPVNDIYHEIISEEMYYDENHHLCCRKKINQSNIPIIKKFLNDPFFARTSNMINILLATEDLDGLRLLFEDKELMNQKELNKIMFQGNLKILKKLNILPQVIQSKLKGGCGNLFKSFFLYILFLIALIVMILCFVLSEVVANTIVIGILSVLISCSSAYFSLCFHPVSEDSQFSYRFLANLFLVGYIIDFYYAFSTAEICPNVIKPQEKIKNSTMKGERVVNVKIKKESTEEEEMKELLKNEDVEEQQQNIKENKKISGAKLIEKDKYDDIQIYFTNGRIESKIRKQNEVDAGEKSLDTEIINGNSLFNPMELVEAIEKIGEKIQGRTYSQLKALSLVFGNIELDLMPFIPSQEKAKDKIDMRFISSVFVCV
jgi:hypothetical protein